MSYDSTTPDTAAGFAGRTPSEESADGLRTLLKREESYAIHALINIAENPGTNKAEIAERLKIPPAFLAKVLRKLVNAGFIESHMGRSGGVKLLVDLKDVSLLDIVEKVSGALVLDTCQTKEFCATERRKGHCNLKVAWINTTLGVHALFSRVKLAELCD